MELTLLYVIIAGFTAIGFSIYLHNLFLKYRNSGRESKISAYSWLIWLGAEALNLKTCIQETENQWELTFAYVCTFASLLIVLTAFKLRMFAKISTSDWIILFGLVVSIFVWKRKGDVDSANWIVLFAICIGYYSTVKGVVKKEVEETSLPWFLVGAGSVFTLITYAISKESNELNIRFAIVGGAGEFAVGIAALVMNRKKMIRR